MNREQLEEIRAEWEKQNAAHLAAKRNWRCCSACELADARVPALLDEIDRLNKKIKSFEEVGFAEALRAGGRERTEYAVRVDRPVPRRKEKAGDIMTHLCAETALYASKVWDGWTTLERTVRVWPDGSTYMGAWKSVTDPLAEYHRLAATTAEGSAEGGTSKGSSEVSS